jgi:Activator of Hsp90 ATPase homolog 1-like protein
VIEPLRLSFTVGCNAADAFDMWTLGMSMWWPTSHTVSGERDAVVVIEPRVGGRIFERMPSGEELDWGWITSWQRPLGFVYRWHISTPPEQATEVEVRFTEQPNQTTRVEIEHRGFELLGIEGQKRRDSNRAGWEALIPRFAAACTERIAQLRAQPAKGHETD